MSHVFVSYAERDIDTVAEIVHRLEDEGLSCWYYHRDMLPGLSYLTQIASAMERCGAVLVVISPDSMRSAQVTSEIVRGFETGKPFLPVLKGVTHERFQREQPEWRGALRASTSITLPAEGLGPIMPRVLRGLSAMLADEGPSPVVVPTPTPTPADGPVLRAGFDRESYPVGDDPLAYFLAEFRLPAAAPGAADGPDADIALALDVSGSMDRPDRYPLLREAVRELILRLGPSDRVSITLFSDRSETVALPISGEDAREAVGELLDRMDRSPLLFGPRTRLAPALGLCLDALGPAERSGGRVRRVYVLTDGELHDTPDCESVLDRYRPMRAEVHVYGFGDAFNAADLKRLVSDQIGGTVKPVCDEADIVRTFAHVANVNRRLVGRDARLAVEFAPGVTCGDAWVFRPTSRHLGQIEARRADFEIGGLEAGRTYSMLLEARVPPDEGADFATVRAAWTEGERERNVEIRVEVPRRPGATPDPSPEFVRRAFDSLNALRNEHDPAAVLASLTARRELAVLEGRDPNLIAALEKMIDNLTTAAAGRVPADPDSFLSAEEELYLDSDPSTVTEWDLGDPKKQTGPVPPPRPATPGETSDAAKEILQRMLKRPRNP